LTDLPSRSSEEELMTAQDTCVHTLLLNTAS
jgi:hypothetical protein